MAYKLRKQRVLNRDIKQDKKITGINIKNDVDKSRAFADDLVIFFLLLLVVNPLFLENPKTSIKYLMKKLHEFGALVDFKINKKQQCLSRI